MANVKISELTAASALDGTELLESVQGGTNKKATVQQAADFARLTPINNQTGTSYTLVLTDAGKSVRCSNASAIALTVPQNSSVAYPVGTSIAVRQVAAGAVTASGSGVTLNIPTGYTATTGRQGATMMLHKVDTNTWDVTGDLAAA